MNWEQLKAIIWLRWRLTANQVNRQGKIWAVIVLLILWMCVLTSLSSFFVALSLGWIWSWEIEPVIWMCVWDGLIVAFLGVWLFGLMIELQQSELLSLQKLLHLPLSLSGTFVLNYLTSLISISALFFVSCGMGLATAMIVTRGPANLVLPPLVVTSVLLVSALTYQFQGWLGTMMENPRRRRTVIATITFVIIMVAQLPNLINLSVQRALRDRRNGAPNDVQFIAEFQERVARGEVTEDQLPRELSAFQVQQHRERAETRREMVDQLQAWAGIANAVIPFGWLAYGAREAAHGNAWPGLFATTAGALLAAVSLQRSYRTALRMYTGVVGGSGTVVASVTARQSTTAGRNMLERTIPWVSERTAAIAWASLRTLSRAPELKLMLIGPLTVIGVLATLMFAHGFTAVPPAIRPLIALLSMVTSLLGAAQFLQNQFGMDRGGFRVLVLTAAPRSEVLLGKNLALFPVVVGMGTTILACVWLVISLKWSHVLALELQLISTFVLYCLIANLASIWFPAAVATGGSKPASANTRAVLGQLMCGLMVPLICLPAVGSLGIDALTSYLFPDSGIPVFLGLSLLESAIIVWIYARVIPLQGQLLQRHEQTIAQAVAPRAE